MNSKLVALAGLVLGHPPSYALKLGLKDLNGENVFEQGASMRTLRAALSALSLVVIFIGFAVQAQEQVPPKLQQFVYMLKVSPSFHDARKWTQRENDAVARHFARLKEATAAGRVIFAGKTSEPLDATFGLVVFEAEDEKGARQFMESDPAVVAGVMSATLHPYVLALQRQ